MVTNSAKNSAITMDNHTPVMPINPGRINTIMIWNTKVRRKEIAADTAPLFSAVKKEDPQTFMPLTRNAIA